MENNDPTPPGGNKKAITLFSPFGFVDPTSFTDFYSLVHVAIRGARAPLGWRSGGGTWSQPGAPGLWGGTSVRGHGAEAVATRSCSRAPGFQGVSEAHGGIPPALSAASSCLILSMCCWDATCCRRARAPYRECGGRSAVCHPNFTPAPRLPPCPPSSDALGCNQQFAILLSLTIHS